jgi:serine/threonine-protein kinase ATR
MYGDDTQIEVQQCELLLIFTKIACVGSRCLEVSRDGSQHWRLSVCGLCDGARTPNHESNPYWDDKDVGEDWKDTIAAMLAITKEQKFQSSLKARVLMAVAIGRVFNHISDVEYLNLESCELGQWLLGSMSRSLRELKLAATYVKHCTRKSPADATTGAL